MPGALVVAGLAQHVSAVAQAAFVISNRSVERSRFPSVRSHCRHAMLEDVCEVVFANHKDECFPVGDRRVKLGASGA